MLYIMSIDKNASIPLSLSGTRSALKIVDNRFPQLARLRLVLRVVLKPWMSGCQDCLSAVGRAQVKPTKIKLLSYSIFYLI